MAAPGEQGSASSACQGHASPTPAHLLLLLSPTNGHSVIERPDCAACGAQDWETLEHKRYLAADAPTLDAYLQRKYRLLFPACAWPPPAALDRLLPA